MKPIPISTTNVKAAPIILALCCIVFCAAVVIVAFLANSKAFAKPAPQEQAQDRSGSVSQPVELGNVRWQRDLNSAVADSKQKDKPIAILFQEVPG